MSKDNTLLYTSKLSIPYSKWLEDPNELYTKDTPELLRSVDIGTLADFQECKEHRLARSLTDYFMKVTYVFNYLLGIENLERYRDEIRVGLILNDIMWADILTKAIEKLKNNIACNS